MTYTRYQVDVLKALGEFPRRSPWMLAQSWFYGRPAKDLRKLAAPTLSDDVKALLDHANAFATGEIGRLNELEMNQMAWVCSAILWEVIFADEVAPLGLIASIEATGLRNLAGNAIDDWLELNLAAPAGKLYGPLFDLRSRQCCQYAERDVTGLRKLDLATPMEFGPDTKEMLFVFLGPSMQILVPKERGQGFRKVPIGHHQTALGSLDSVIGFDMFGLDGAIHVETGYVSPFDYPKMIERVLEPISRLLGYRYRHVGLDEFWEKHPIPPDDQQFSAIVR